MDVEPDGGKDCEMELVVICSADGNVSMGTDGSDGKRLSRRFMIRPVEEGKVVSRDGQ